MFTHSSLARGLVLGAVLATSMLATGAQAADLRLKFAGTLPVEHQGTKTMEQIAKTIEDADVGLKVTVFPANQLGSGEELFEDTIRGNIDFSMGFIYAHKDPAFEIASMPYLAGDWDEMSAVLRNPDSAYNQVMGEHLDAIGLHLLQNNPEGFANVLSTKEPKNWDTLDPKDMNIRVWSSNVVKDTMKELGFNTTTIAWADIFPALQSGIVDGAECCTKQATYTIFAKSGVGSYYIDYNAFMEISTFYASNKTWAKLNDEQRAVVEKAFAEASDSFFQWNRDNDAAFEQKLVESGYTVLTPSPEKAAAMRDAVRAKIWPQMADIVGQDVLDRIKADVE
ncbi:TRAP transporter substrate-binding protein DctP [Pseudooceanicola sp. CBS1P-1]|uniref:Transporter n=1 Tax=Pseudooceanicola albus TaxID=2692189 RepID=A0A6L7G6E8_9RHOB|nr:MULTISPECIES: TRAP transporter substrate-binding protein DctP [Pseudooceanicola]MBT9385904.1 TRAP transporter substrate-binding protein DctP [Pseudooceanicola endophyticus]MXN19675.1 transporter [Pseudooceanicola albus]